MMRLARRYQRILLSLLFISFMVGIILGISLITDTEITTGLSELFGVKTKEGRRQNKIKERTDPKLENTSHLPPSTIKVLDNEEKERSKILDKSGLTPKLEIIEKPLVLQNNIHLKSAKMDKGNEGNSDTTLEKTLAKLPAPNYKAHVFYYPWYGNPKVDGNYLHWNHVYISHWDKKEAKRWPRGKHVPPEDIGSDFYPELGPYSSRDAAVLENHMQQIRTSAAGVLAVSWYPPGLADDNGLSWDDLMMPLMDHAHRYQLKVCFHIEPYKERNSLNLKANLEYIIRTYGDHPAMYKYKKNGRDLPLFYIYDSYLVPKDEWKRLLKADGDRTVRGTAYDAVFIGLLVDQKHQDDILRGGFDGFYTYFASDGFTFGSSSRNWQLLSLFAETEKLLFIPSVGPGYIDERVRPWNSRNTKSRESGKYYDQCFQAAIAAKPTIISITSFNEWHEGTQIERAVPKKITGYKYADYSPMEPDFYLSLTRKWLFKFDQQQRGKT